MLNNKVHVGFEEYLLILILRLESAYMGAIPGFLKANEIYYPRVISSVKKSSNPLQPLFEVITNSIEAIELREGNFKGEISLTFDFTQTSLESDSFFDSITVEDNGIGFNAENFKRLNRWKDDRKGFNNRGSGRVQLVHHFEKCEYFSVYQEEGKFWERQFSLSKNQEFVRNNALIFFKSLKGTEQSKYSTRVFLRSLIDDSDKRFYNKLNLLTLKETIVTHYVARFHSSSNFPAIQIKWNINGKKDDSLEINSSDFPNVDKEDDFKVLYSKFDSEGNLTKSARSENFHLKCFRLSSRIIKKNKISIVSKGEISSEINLTCLTKSDTIDNDRFLFLISGDYIDKRDGDTRGDFKFVSKSEFTKNQSQQMDLFSGEELLIEDIQEKTNETIESKYKQILQKKEERLHDIESLQEMFLLNKQTINTLSFNLNDDESKILEKVYQSDAKIQAKKDAAIKSKIESLNSLDTSSKSYDNDLHQLVNELVIEIPLQNRTALTHYVARRRLVLELFKKILNRQLYVQEKSERNIDEKLLHNILFQQSSTNPNSSDLWLINEDFIYFKGCSEIQLSDVMIDGELVFKEELTTEEEKHRVSLSENRYIKRPDVLLFPDEGKCIILEFKNPDVNVSEHLNQINRYSSLILNYCKDGYNINTFYGYLIGEKLSADDIRDYDADYKDAYHFDYLVRPHKTIAGKFGRNDGSLYTEVIQYSTLLERAIKRNEVFIDKLNQDFE